MFRMNLVSAKALRTASEEFFEGRNKIYHDILYQANECMMGKTVISIDIEKMQTLLNKDQTIHERLGDLIRNRYSYITEPNDPYNILIFCSSIGSIFLLLSFVNFWPYICCLFLNKC